MYDEADLLPISALQHLAFCPRQCALIYLEGAWRENLLTAQGRRQHERAHELGTERRGDVLIVRGLRLHSLRLGLAGQADVVEFWPAADGVALPDLPGTWRPFPVEHKRGRPKPDHCDLVQLCAQSLCLEEMLSVSVPEGAIFYGEPRRRLEVTIDPGLRAETEDLAVQLHRMVNDRITPEGHYEGRCRSCSLFDLCMPRSATRSHSASRYLSRNLEEILGGDPQE